MRAVEVIEVQCPHCYSQIQVQVEADLDGEVVWDCEVCCHPIELQVRHGPDGAVATVLAPDSG